MNSADLIEAGEQVMSDFNVGKNLTNDIILLLSIGLFAPVVEEIIFRGGIFSNVGFIIALIVSSYLFMSIHGGSGQDAQIYLLFILGAFAAIAMYLTKSLFGAILVHAVNNNLVFIYALLKLDKTGTSHTLTLIIVSILCFFACIPLAYFFGKILPQKK